MGFSDKFKDAVKGVQAGENMAEKTEQFDVMDFLKQRLGASGIEPVADDKLNSDLVAEGPGFVEQAKTAIGTMSQSVDDLVERTPALKATRNFVSDGWSKLMEKFTPEAAVTGAAAGASADSLKQLFGKAEGKVDTMDLRPYEIDPSKLLPDWLKRTGPSTIVPVEPSSLEPGEPKVKGDDIDKEALDKVVSGLTEEEKAMMTEFQTAMGNKMLDVIEMGANYGVSGENVQDSLEDMCQNYMSQMTPEQMATMIGVIQKCGNAGLITKDSTMEDVSKVMAEVIKEGADKEKVAENLKERVDEVSGLAREKGLGLNVKSWLRESLGVSLYDEVPAAQRPIDDNPRFDKPVSDEFVVIDEDKTKLRADAAKVAFGITEGAEALQTELQ